MLSPEQIEKLKTELRYAIGLARRDPYESPVGDDVAEKAADAIDQLQRQVTELSRASINQIGLTGDQLQRENAALREALTAGEAALNHLRLVQSPYTIGRAEIDRLDEALTICRAALAADPKPV